MSKKWEAVHKGDTGALLLGKENSLEKAAFCQNAAMSAQSISQSRRSGADREKSGIQCKFCPPRTP